MTLLVALALAPCQAAVPPDDLQSIWTLEIRRSDPVVFTQWAQDEQADVRARTALALGRLADPAALPLLTELAADRDARVRGHAAFALGLTPDGAPLLRERLNVERDRAVRVRLLQALGLHEDLADEGLLAAALDRSWSESAEASIALGRLAIAHREHVFRDETLIALGRQLTRLKPRARRGAAFALARMAPEALPESLVRELRHQALDAADPTVRAWCLRALASAQVGDEGMRLVALAARDGDEGVRVAAARFLGRLEVPPAGSTVQELLADDAPGVRLETIHSLGRLDSVDHEALLRPVLDDPDEILGAAALGVLLAQGDEPSARPWLAEDQPLRLQAAAIASLDDGAQLARLAVGSPEPLVRTTAVGTLEGLPGASEHVATLLGASDDKVAAVGAMLLQEDGRSAEVLETLVERLAGTEDLDLLLEGFEALAVAHEAQEDLPDGLDQVVAGALTHRAKSVREAAEPLAAALDLPPPPPMDPVAKLPLLTDIARIQSARILTEHGEIRVTLRPDLAPLTVWNFATLADDDYFDGLHFHRVVPDFVIQDGCPRGDGWGDPGHQIPDELSWLAYDEGTLGMALAGPDTGGSQWFITLSPQPHLESRYAVFGQVSLDNGVPGDVAVDTVIDDVIIERVGWDR